MKVLLTAALLLSGVAFAATDLVYSGDAWSAKANLGFNNGQAVLKVESTEPCYNGARCTSTKSISLPELSYDSVSNEVSYKGVVCGEAVTVWRGSAHYRFPVVLVKGNGNCSVEVEDLGSAVNVYLNY